MVPLLAITLAPAGCKKEPPPAPPPYAVPQGIALAVSAASTPPRPSRQLIVIARDRISVGDKRVAGLERGQWREDAAPPLRAALSDRPTTILADADTPFRTLAHVIAATKSRELDLLVRNGGVGGAEMAVPIDVSADATLGQTPPGWRSGPFIALRPNGYTVVLDGKPLQVDDEGELIRLVHQSKTAASGRVAMVNAVDEKPLQELVRLLDLLRPDYPRVRFYLPVD